jgi:hypothetical protein
VAPSLRATSDESVRRADAHRDVVAVLHQVHEAVVEAHVERDRGMGAREVADRRAEVEDAERHRRAHAQAPARLRLQVRHRGLGLLDALDRAAARLEERAPASVSDRRAWCD